MCYTDNDYINTNSEISWEELEWLKMINIKYIIDFSKLSPIYLVTNKLNSVASRRLLEIGECVRLVFSLTIYITVVW